MEEKQLITIDEAAKILGISKDTLRRWEKSGRLKPIEKSAAGYRLYSKSQLEIHLNDLYKLAKNWDLKQSEIPENFYCSNSAIFQTKLAEIQNTLSQVEEIKNIFPLVVAIAGEIGNNSFDHNLGNWPDVPGIFFGCDINKKTIVLADRGVGILATLKRVRPELKTDKEALKVAFTEIVSGRAPENRGNGLKFVRQVIIENPIKVLFKTGNVELQLNKEEITFREVEPAESFHGCLAIINF